MTTSPVSLSNVSGISQTQEMSPVAKSEKVFSDVLKSTVDQVNKADMNGDAAIQNLFTGEAQNLHEIMVASEEADISIRMLVQLRNKALEAYNEIMRMQI